ncbi:hypothetical protein SS1G_12354 [Sclerotinia sclerotiorum 1980 UF-70]|uniref:HTH CENPB-type domain-containing protein n=1 Tax=Sclerotinia sclerotiorum (strain ATCC 18683 / 1980 / Ss-1) TaxID=665079 RepID=A7F356_SCLS1|nr:hypothetical protein SS1G_12354 [Sclerotinia sclerotiorum 1980 UF-70]EDN96148.1 hypothetical protein SS1G_12354 [Sclerotinia sclerotiorum 1980 UF-70]
MNGLTPCTEFRPKSHNLIDLEEEVLIQYILDMDKKGFSPRISDMEDIANYILEMQGAKKVGKLWTHRFVKRYTELKTCFNRVYDFQRALCEDSEFIERRFRLVSNMQAKYGDLLYDWLIKPTINRWTDNETDLEWIKHFNKHIESRKVGRYRMLILDRHENHKSPAFQEYYKEHNIILLSLLPHSLYLTQPLDINCFDPLKCSYNRQIENFIKAHITYITKTEFFQAFKAQSQTSHNPTEVLSQSTLVKSRIAQHQGSSSTPIFETIAALAKGIELLAYANTLLTAEVHNLRKANKALSKHRRVRKALIRKRGAFSIEDKHSILEQENVEDQIQHDEYTNDGSSARRQATIRRCSKCGSTLHNARTYKKGFVSKLNDIEDIMNYILESQGAKKVGKL